MNRAKICVLLLISLLLVCPLLLGKPGGGGSGKPFNPVDHPRGPDGRFIKKDGGGGGPVEPPPEPPTTATSAPATKLVLAATLPASRPAPTSEELAAQAAKREELHQQAIRLKAQMGTP